MSPILFEFVEAKLKKTPIPGKSGCRTYTWNAGTPLSLKIIVKNNKWIGHNETLQNPEASGLGTPDVIRQHLTLREVEAPKPVDRAGRETVAQRWFTRFCLKGRFSK